MHREPLDLKHKDLLVARFKELHLDFSEYTFAHAYLNRHNNQTQIIKDEEKIFLKRISFDHFPYLTLTTFPEKNDFGKIYPLMEEVDFIYPIPQEWISHFDPTYFSFEIKERDNDYLYYLNKIQTLDGPDLASRRNLVKQFEKNEEIKIVPLTEEVKEDAKGILDQWNAHNGLQKESNDYYECLEAINKMEVLQLTGLIYYVDAVPVGFLIGEPLMNSFALHFAKGNVEYKGIYSYMYQNFSQTLNQKFAFLNLEDDLDNPSIRKAKLAYHPDLILKKVRVHKKRNLIVK